MSTERTGLEGRTQRDKPFTQRERRRLARQSGYGHRPVNKWGDGDLPAPYAEGDLLLLPEGADLERLYDMAPGYFVVSCAFSIDDGDAWYFRVANHRDGRSSDRLHVAYADRCTWGEDCDWLAAFQLVDTADPDGLAHRERLLAAGWSFTLSAADQAEADHAGWVAVARQLADALTELDEYTFGSGCTHELTEAALAAFRALDTQPDTGG